MAGGVLHQVVAIKDVAAADKDQLQGPLTLGTLPTIGPYLLPQFIPLLQKTASQLSLYPDSPPPHRVKVCWPFSAIAENGQPTFTLCGGGESGFADAQA